MRKSMSCKISIITVVLNSKRYFEQSILSVIEQTYENIEFIVVDGGSTDGTLDVIDKYKSTIDYWVSEPDDGISHAMNKGVKAATGDYILFLQSDDYLLDETVIRKAVECFTHSCEIYIFPVILDNQGTKQKSHNKTFNWKTNFKMGSCHQGQFYSREFFLQLGVFDEGLKICMDYDFLLRAFRAGSTAVNISDFPLSVMRSTGISSRQEWSAELERFLEERTVHKKNCPGVWMAAVYKIYWSLYFPYRRILAQLRTR